MFIIKNLSFYIKKLSKKLLVKINKTFFLKSAVENQQKFQEIIADLNPQNQKIIYFHHDLGGGSDLYIQNKIEEYKNDAYIFIIVYRTKIKKFSLQLIFKNQSGTILFDNIEELFAVFKNIKIDTIYISQVLLFPDIEAVFNFTHQAKKQSKIVMLMHDYYSICTRIFLTKIDGSKCDMIANKTSCDCNPFALEHVKRWQNFLENQPDEIIFFSTSSKDIVTKFYPFIADRTKVIPHHVNFLRKVKVKKHKTINIATIGSLHTAKGCEVVKEMSEIILNNNLPVKIISIGRFWTTVNKAIKVLGKYEREDLPRIIENNKIDIVLIPSIWPETFNYTTHEAIMMGIKVACFDLGAQAEYVKKYDKGLVISKIDAKTALDEILKFVKANN